MSFQALLTTLLLPPVALVLACVAGGLLAWRGWRTGGLIVALAAGLQLALATPLCANLLAASLEREVMRDAAPLAGAPPPAAIIILGAEAVLGEAGSEVGPLTLERLRAGAALHRRTGLPLLVTGGPAWEGSPPLAMLMARSLTLDFGVTVRWLEPAAHDTRENAGFGAAMLQAAGIRSAYLVTHAWHMPRAQAAFARLGFATTAAPVRVDAPPRGEPAEFVPRADYWAESWYMLREWAGRLVYAIRD
jgi:uncharacterized SAM-binding protein YcdF (DUF218 family)